MNKQNFEIKNDQIKADFMALKKEHSDKLQTRLKLSWSNWGFGIKTLEESAARLEQTGVQWIELHGNHYGSDLGYKPTLETLDAHGIKVAGICGMFSLDNDPASNRPNQRQAAIDYIQPELDFAQAVGARFMLVCPSAVCRPEAYDDSEFERSVEVYQTVAPDFAAAGIKAAVEPIRSAEVSLCHTVADAQRFIAAINHPSIQHINEDVHPMQFEEAHITTAILKAGERLTNLHLADSNRCALGEGSLDLDTILMTLYLVGYNRPGCFATPEPLGLGGNPYPAMNGKPDRETLEHLVQQTARYFREREAVVLGCEVEL